MSHDFASLLADLEPEQTTLKLGGVELVLAESTLHQQGRILKAITGLDIGALAVAVLSLIQRERKVEAGDEGAVTVGGILERLSGRAGEIWVLAQKVLGDQLAPVLRAIATAALDTPENFKRLQAAGERGIAKDAAPNFANDGSYTGCPAVCGWLADRLTLDAAARIARATWELNGYLDALGNLLPLVTRQTPGAKSTAVH